MMMRRGLVYGVLAAMTLAFTVFVYANTYEVLFNRLVPFGVALDRMADQTVINSTLHQFATKPGNVQDYENISNLDAMDYFEIPSLQARVYVESGRHINSAWYQRPSLAGYLALNKNEHNVPIDYLIYTNASWLTIPQPSQLDTGTEVTLYLKDGSQAHFHVAEKQVSPFSRSLLVDKTQSRQILLVVEEPSYDVYYGYSLVQDT